MNQYNYSKKILEARQARKLQGRTNREKNIVMYFLVFLLLLGLALSK